jgi:hypothetical protein
VRELPRGRQPGARELGRGGVEAGRTTTAHGIRNGVWISTDVHFAEAFRHVPFSDDPGFAVHELVTGPMNAGIFPTTDFDSTLNPERLTFFGPASASAVTSWSQAKPWFSFGSSRSPVTAR